MPAVATIKGQRRLEGPPNRTCVPDFVVTRPPTTAPRPPASRHEPGRRSVARLPALRERGDANQIRALLELKRVLHRLVERGHLEGVGRGRGLVVGCIHADHDADRWGLAAGRLLEA